MAKKAKSPSKAVKKKSINKTARKPVAKKTPPKGAPAKKSLRRPAPKSKAKKVEAPAPLPWRKALPGETFVGIVDDFYGHVSVIAFNLQGALAVGDKIHVRGHTTDMTETVDSMQIDHNAVTSAKAGDAVGVRTVGKCRSGDYVYRVG